MSRLDTCPVDSLPRYGDLSKIFGMVWRFLPLLDPLVDAVASRDLDSRLTGREAAAVTQWLEESGLPFHVMRDHPMHGTEILGGMWGARLDTGHRDQLRGAMERLLASVRSHTGHTSSLILCAGQRPGLAQGAGPDAADEVRVAGGEGGVLRARLLPLHRVQVPTPAHTWPVSVPAASYPLCRSDHWLPYPTRRLPGVPYNFIGAAGPMVLNRCGVDS